MPNLHKHLKWFVPLLFFVTLVAFFTFVVAPPSEASELIASAAPEKIESVEIQVEQPAPSPECVKVSSKEDPSTWDQALLWAQEKGCKLVGFIGWGDIETPPVQ